MAEDLRDPPRQTDRHPRGHDPLDRAGHHEELPLGAREVAREGEAAAALAEELTHERHRRAREEAAPDGDVIAVLDPGDGVLERRELLCRRLRLGLEPPPRGDEVVLGGVHRRSSHPAWYRSSAARVRASIGWSRAGTSTCLASPHRTVV